MTAWPASLPQSFLLQGYIGQETPRDIRSATEYGPFIQRRRYSAASELIQGRMQMTLTQWNTAKVFKDTTLNSVDTFSWVHPVTQVAVSDVRFISGEPKALQIVSNLKGDLFLVNLIMEFLE